MSLWEKKIKTVQTIVPGSATLMQTVASMFCKQSEAYPTTLNEQLVREQDFMDRFVHSTLTNHRWPCNPENLFQLHKPIFRSCRLLQVQTGYLGHLVNSRGATACQEEGGVYWQQVQKGPFYMKKQLKKHLSHLGKSTY